MSQKINWIDATECLPPEFTLLLIRGRTSLMLKEDFECIEGELWLEVKWIYLGEVFLPREGCASQEISLDECTIESIYPACADNSPKCEINHDEQTQDLFGRKIKYLKNYPDIIKKHISSQYAWYLGDIDRWFKVPKDDR